MKLLHLILFASLGANAAESYASSDDLSSTVAAYSRAAKLQPLKDSAEDELRVWRRGYMNGDIEGYVVSKRRAIKCRATSGYRDGVVSIDRARCSRWRNGDDAFGATDDLVALDGKEWDCPVDDGFVVYVEGVHNGRRFALRAGNPTLCSDSDSRAVANLLSKLDRS